MLAAKTEAPPSEVRQESSMFTTPSSGVSYPSPAAYDKYASPLTSTMAKSFAESNNSDLPQSSIGEGGITTSSDDVGSHNKTGGVKLQNYSEAESLASRSTKASSVFPDSLRLGQCKTKTSNEGLNLPIIHEELQVEEGCDNELEKSRLTL